MSYRCQVCDTVVPSGSPLRKYVTYRSLKSQRAIKGRVEEYERKEIAKEIPCCSVCLTLLDGGMPIALVIRNRRTIVTPTGQPSVIKREAQIQPPKSPKPAVKAVPMKPVALTIGTLLNAFPPKKRKA